MAAATDTGRCPSVQRDIQQVSHDNHPCVPMVDNYYDDVFSFVSGHWLTTRSLPVIPFYRYKDEEFGEDLSTSINQLGNEFNVNQRLRALIVQLSKRAQRVRKSIIQPATPPSSQSPAHSNATFDWTANIDEENTESKFKSWTIDPQTKCSVFWLSLVSLCFVYNAWSIVLRATFPYQTASNVHLWMTIDYTADLIYLIDLTIYKPHLKLLHQGLLINEPKETRKIYVKSRAYVMDLLSLFPLDLLYFYYGVIPLLRLPRLLKIETFWEFFNRCDHIASSPYIVRIIHTLMYMLYLIHINACAYYAYSDYEGIGRPDNFWIYNGEGNAYIRCFFFSTKIATSIGKNPIPTHEGEWLFMIASWLSGIFVFAILIGQIRDILSVATARDQQYRRVVDRTLAYIHRLHLPETLNFRARKWFAYNKLLQANLDENDILRSLPLKMEMDVAMSVHSNVLNQVQLFQGFDRNLVRELMLKLKPYLYLPGDFVCRKGDVGKEMYIINYGQLMVLKGKSNEASRILSEGSVFGEISLVSPIGGGNRCTADVRSKGFSNVFILTKCDLLTAIKHYPHSQQLLQQRAKRIIKSALSKQPVDPRPPTHNSTPKLIKTVLEVVPADSKIQRYLNSERGSVIYPPRVTVSAPPPTNKLPEDN